MLAKRVSLWLATVAVSAGTVYQWKNKDEAAPTVDCASEQSHEHMHHSTVI